MRDTKEKERKILIVSRDISIKQDGGTLVSKRNERILKQAGFKTERFVIPIPDTITRIKNILFRQSYGETSKLKTTFIEKLNTKYDYVFFDGSIYGAFVKIANDKGFKTICFYHNVEYNYYKQKFEQTRSLADRLMIPFIKYNESLSTRYSKYIITLNDRDSQHLFGLYQREADVILPTSFPKKDIKSLYRNLQEKGESYLLFVGTNFFANIAGLERFLHRVAPKIIKKIKVIGNIKDAFNDRNDIPSNVEFIGKVESLDDYYINASGVISPIFSGSGLKTKTVEAISFGKTVIGYPEAFEGIEWKNYPGACFQVDSDEEFIEAINVLDDTQKYNPLSALLFEETLCDEVQVKKLLKVL